MSDLQRRRSSRLWLPHAQAPRHQGHRIKAFATVSMYDMVRDRRQHLPDNQTDAQRTTSSPGPASSAGAEAAGAKTDYVMGTPPTITDDSPGSR
jgi:hypothetical protein